MTNTFKLGLVKTVVLLLLAGLALPGAAAAAEISCVQCHESQSGRLGEPVKQWRESIHQQNGIACNNCHGGDPTLMSMEAMSPDRGFRGVPSPEEIPDFCGHCHVGVKEDYLASAHGKALGKGGPQCVTCHGNHAVKRASPDLINPQDCSRCHEYGRAAEMKKAVLATDEMIGNLQDQLEALHRVGISTKEMKGKVFSERNQFHQLFHTVDVDLVRSKTAAIQGQLQKVQQQIDGIKSDLGQRKLAGAVAIGLLVLAGILLLLISRTYREEAGSD